MTDKNGVGIDVWRCSGRSRKVRTSDIGEHVNLGLKHNMNKMWKEDSQIGGRHFKGLRKTAVGVLTLSTGIEGHVLHKFQNEPIMRNSENLFNTLKATEVVEYYKKRGVSDKALRASRQALSPTTLPAHWPEQSIHKQCCATLHPLTPRPRNVRISRLQNIFCLLSCSFQLLVPLLSMRWRYCFSSNSVANGRYEFKS